MTKKINPCMTVHLEGDFVVFLIGMRINRWWKIHKWFPVAMAMPRLLKELAHSPDSGFLGAEMGLGIIVQYWKTFEQLEAYARDQNLKHFPVWKAFNKKMKCNGDVGIWHETYKISAGEYECIYNQMPPYGLGKVGELIPAVGKKEFAAGRLGKKVDS